MGLLLAEAICVTAFIVEIGRALGGNSLSWAYVFEWPIFALYAVYVWRKLLGEERSTAAEVTGEYEPEDPALVKYNEYLDTVHRDRSTDESH